jgi:hypothetical protein
MAQTYTERATFPAETTGTIAEAAGGLAIVVLAIIGLARTDIAALPGVAVIILGAALLAEGGAIAAEFSRLLSITSGGLADVGQFGSGMAMEFVMGAAVLVLGILALLGVASATLMAAAVVATGALLLLTASSVRQINQLKVATAGPSSEGTQALLVAASAGSTGFQVLAGIAAIVLGILALASGSTTVSFTLTGLLVLGASLALSGSALTGSIMRLLRR